MEKKWLVGVAVIQTASLAAVFGLSYRLYSLDLEQSPRMTDAAALGCDLQTQDAIKKLASEQRFEFDDLRKRVIAANASALAAKEAAHSINRTMIVRDLTHP